MCSRSFAGYHIRYALQYREQGNPLPYCSSGHGFTTDQSPQNPGKRSSGLSFQARRVHRTAIACPSQKVWHEKHIMQILLFSGKTPSPFTLTKTPMEHRSTHLKWLWQCWDLSHRSGSIYTSIPTLVAGPTSTVISFLHDERA
jgi:hypothetical protein